ncbi:aminoacyl-tRNA hydrolase [Lacibacter luteus]|uniref:Peptidyl-tRNA hydrolase n=1 Tax=Lacibacter luteus TaxID=2508719 RepID=A0A4Q1CE05_9BACT|nr:aminoacyl-tRNA hydrolase [Lacibacter luteus]RXK57850.1 aminoacyl-tRNA hydrolase [Lacibacter luteus]
MKFLIVGLGNIGAEYAHTRHNIGFDVVEALAAKYAATFRTDRLAAVTEFKIKGKQLIVIEPSTYMNLSGKAVKYWMDKEKIPVEQVLVVVDELALPVTKLRLRPGGSDAGHNGLKSIQELLQTNTYPRLRFGIGNNYPKGRQAEFVLSKWNEEELPVVQKKIAASVEVIESFVLTGIERTMNHANKIEITL